MATPSINNWLQTESGRIMYDINQRLIYTSPWLTLPRKVAFPEQMGETISTIMWERPWVETENAWEDVTLNAGDGSAGGTCLPPVDDVEFYQTLRSMGLKHKAMHSPKFCVNDLRFTGGREKQMGSVVTSLSDQAKIYWIAFNRLQWLERAAYKIVFDASLTSGGEGDAMPSAAADYQLTQGVLDYYYNILTLEGAGQMPLTRSDGRPVFGLITDQITSKQIRVSDDSIREDWRQSSQSDKLLAALGVSCTYSGYVHMMDDMPPRYTHNGSIYTEVVPLVRTGSPGSYKVEINPAYLAADYQDSILYVPSAIQIRVPGSITSVGKAKFNPQDYVADFKWQNILDEDDNPDGTIGRFRGVAMAGGETLNPYHAVVIRHKICPLDLGGIGCA